MCFGRYGASIKFDSLYDYFIDMERLYRTDLKRYAEGELGVALHEVPIADPTRLFLLKYDKVGMHIGYHYDNNFYSGRYFTVLVVLENSCPDKCSKFTYLNESGQTTTLGDERPGDIVVFEGATTFHKATCMRAKGLRVVMSCTYTTDTTVRCKTLLKMKNKAFF